jgi:hypothetical protein
MQTLECDYLVQDVSSSGATPTLDLPLLCYDLNQTVYLMDDSDQIVPFINPQMQNVNNEPSIHYLGTGHINNIGFGIKATALAKGVTQWQSPSSAAYLARTADRILGGPHYMAFSYVNHLGSSLKMSEYRVLPEFGRWRGLSMGRRIDLGEGPGENVATRLFNVSMSTGTEFAGSVADLEIEPQSQFVGELDRLLEEEPMEAGQLHPAEDLMERASTVGPELLGQWMLTAFSSTIGSQPSVAADILTCVGTYGPDRLAGWGPLLLKIGLMNGDIRVRDAAATALEDWGSEAAAEILEERVEREKVSWLADYMRRVLAEITQL